MKVTEMFFTSKYEVGSRVIHNLTNLRGRIVGTETIRGEQKITVDLDSGRQLRNLDRREFNLAERG